VIYFSMLWRRYCIDCERHRKQTLCSDNC